MDDDGIEFSFERSGQPPSPWTWPRMIAYVFGCVTFLAMLALCLYGRQIIAAFSGGC